MNDTQLLLIAMALLWAVTFCIWFVSYMIKMYKTRKLKKNVLIFYVNEANNMEYHVQDMTKSTIGQSFTLGKEEVSFIYDPAAVYTFPKQVPGLGGFRCLYYVHNNVSPINFQQVFRNEMEHKIPQEFYSAIHTKVFTDMMRGLDDGTNTKLSLVMILIIAAIGLGVAQHFGVI